MSLWLTASLALDVAPCSGLALVAGAALGPHGVPEPQPDERGRDLERGYTRSVAQSCVPDNRGTEDLPWFDPNRRRHSAAGLRTNGRQTAAQGSNARGNDGRQAAAQGRSRNRAGTGQGNAQGAAGQRQRAQPVAFVPGVDFQPRQEARKKKARKKDVAGGRVYVRG